jgi:hypothetical protein
MESKNALTKDQIEMVIDWLNQWEQLKGGAIPIRFKEDFEKLRTEKRLSDLEVKAITAEFERRTLQNEPQKRSWFL